MLDIIVGPFMAIVNVLRKLGIVDYPKGHGRYYSFAVYIRAGKGSEKKIRKTILKAFQEVPGISVELVDVAVERLLDQGGGFPLRRLMDEKAGLPPAVDGISFWKIKKIIDKANCGLYIPSHEDVTDEYLKALNNKTAIISLRNKEKKAIADQDFEEADKIKKQIQALEAENQRVMWMFC